MKTGSIGNKLFFMTMLAASLFLQPLIVQTALADELKPFTTDGCSSFPDGTLKQRSLWVNCCIRHDLAYWQGGTYQQRLDADLALEQCVAKVGEPKVAQLMLAGVRVGGSPYWPTSYRWGYGWSYLRGYEPLSKVEKEQVRRQLNLFELMIRTIRKEILKKQSGDD